jgi:mannose-1-phosphate guanylyltransferase
MNGGAQPRTNRAAIVLAGGDGTRLRDLTRRITGQYVPKQFCPLIGSSTLLEQTFDRVALAVAPEHTLTVVNLQHERFYAPLLSHLPPSRLVAQPENRGTAVAIVYALLRMAQSAPEVSVALFPCDHYIDDDAEFMRHVRYAFEAVEERPEQMILLGIVPGHPEPGYGWIECGRPVSAERARICHVRRFWEKPRPEIAAQLMAQGCLWNSFVIVARLSTLLSLVIMAKPELHAAFRSVCWEPGSGLEETKMRSLYAKLASQDFSSEILARFPANLAVLPVCGVAWSDLGEPQRVMDTLLQMGVQPRWASA